MLKLPVSKGRGRALLVACAVVVLVLANEQIIEHFARQRASAHEQSQVLDRLSTLRARLEGVVNANFYLIHGLTAIIATQPDIDQAHFSAIARNLVDERHALRNIGGAPNMVISLMYPLHGNEAALGLDYLAHPIQRKAALRARESGQAVVAGPLALEQGGTGLVVRQPVFLDPPRKGEPAPFWGLISAVIDVDELYRRAGLAAFTRDLELTLRGTDGTGAAGPVFYGRPQVYAKAPVTLDVTIPGGSWQLAAVPKGGWGQEEGGIVLIRLMGLLAAAVAAAMAYRLVRSNQALVESSAKLQESQGLFERFMANLPVGVYIRDPLAQRILFENQWMREHLPHRGAEGGGMGHAEPVTGADDDRRVLEEGQLQTQHTLEGLDGIPRHFDTHAFAIPRADGSLLVGGVIRDITDRHQAQAALQESERRLNEAQRLAKLGNWELDLQTNTLTWSDEIFRIFEIDRARFGATYEAFIETVHPDDREKVNTAYRRAVDTRLPYDITHRLLFADGRVKYVHEMGKTFYAEDGTPLRSVGTVQDVTARKLAEAQARQGEILLDSVFQALPDLFFLMDADGTIRDFRAQRGSDLYVPPETFLNRRMQDVLPSALGRTFQMRLAEIAAGEGIVTYEYDLPIGDEVRHFEARLTRLPDSARVVAVVRDISREHHDRTELAASEARYRQLFEHNPAPLLVYEKGSLRLLAVNEAFVRHYGYSRDEALGLRLTDLYPPDERERVAATVVELNGLVFFGEWQHLRRDGSLIEIEAQSHDLAYEGHDARIVVVNDITERKRAEQALKESEERLRLALQSANQGIYDLDLRTGEAAVSPEYARMLGYDPETFHETHAAWFARLHPDEQQHVRGVFEDYLGGKIPQYRVEFRQRTQDDQWKWILSVGRVQAWDEHGRPVRMLGTHTDITAVRQAEEEIRRLNVELEQRVLARTAELAAVNKELETFSYSVSHDLKAPLRGIDGYSRLLLEDYGDRLDDEGRQFLHNIRRGVEQMGQLIEDLLSYSRMERRSLHSHPLDLSLQVANALNERLAEIKARNVEVEVAVHGLMVHADPEGLAMVLRNLIDNALKFTRDSHPPRLTITARAQGNSIIIGLADNGIGFDMQFHERIFEIFQRLQRAEDYPGTGVGLAIVRKTMQRMGGRVWAESTRGHGATFYLELPR